MNERLRCPICQKAFTIREWIAPHCLPSRHIPFLVRHGLNEPSENPSSLLLLITPLSAVVHFMCSFLIHRHDLQALHTYVIPNNAWRTRSLHREGSLAANVRKQKHAVISNDPAVPDARHGMSHANTPPAGLKCRSSQVLPPPHNRLLVTLRIWGRK